MATTRKEFENVELLAKTVKPGIVVLEMSGSIYMGPDCRRIDGEMEAQKAKESATRFIFDMSRVTHIDSAVVGLIVRIYTQLTKAGGGLRLVGTRGMVDDVLKMTQVNKVIAIYPSVAEAAESFAPATPAA